MASDRIDYGIDLGTTNSVIARMVRGEPTVVRSNRYASDTTPSAVAFGRRGRIRVGKLAYTQLNRDRLHALKQDDPDFRNVFIEFKRTMGTDHVDSPSVDPSIPFTSEEHSAEILKELRRSVVDASVDAAVVTIPAAFTVRQQQATQRAAELAGLRQCHLLQEPVAAAMAFGLQTGEADEKWLVFDFGGGTFDAALVLVEDGVITVSDTEGDNYLGGKDLDRAIVERILLEEVAQEHDIHSYIAEVPARKELLRDALMTWAEQAKNALSSQESHWVESDLNDITLANGDQIELWFELTQERLRPVVEPLFQRAIDKAKTLLNRHGLQGPDLDELILVGGPTYSPILREMLAHQIRAPNTSVDPMTVVARGAALFASTRPIKDHGADKPSVAVRLDLGYEATTVSHDEFVTVKCRDLADLRRFGQLEVEFERKETGWSSGRRALGEDGALFEVKLEEGRPNVFDIVVTTPRGDRVETHPSEITILQGTKVGGSPLTNSLGVAVEGEEYLFFHPMKGAEKGMPLPVTGKRTGLATKEQIRPGVSSDGLLILVYEGGVDAVGVPVALCHHVEDFELTGDQVNRVIPKGSTFDLTVVTGATSNVPETVRVLFPGLDDEEYGLVIPSKGSAEQTGWIDIELAEAQKRIGRMRVRGEVDEETIDSLEAKIVDAAAGVRQAGSDRGDRDQAVALLKEALRGLYGLVDEWSEADAHLDEAWTNLTGAKSAGGCPKCGSVLSDAQMSELEQKLRQVKQAHDVSLARQLAQDMEHAFVYLMRCEWSKQIISWARVNFHQIQWKDTASARMALDGGLRAIMGGEPCHELLESGRRILDLQERGPGDGSSPQGPQPPVLSL
ncbi:MAG: Hsp70 family protein [Gammaproteobacteria bacterium]|nr:Hsp70 family protein [Gammaproteobacteria bacterium]MDE0260486.1 Hsp70 family protein [Gammaproteobacteria bacterium]